VRRKSAFAIAIAIVVTTALVLGLWRSGLSHWLREHLLSLTPERGIDLAIRVAIGVAVLSVAAAGLRRLAPSVYERIAGMARNLTIPRPTPLVALTAIVSAAAGIHILLARYETEPRVFGDEIIYTDLAKNIASQGMPYLHGKFEIGYSVLYPLFISPAYRLASDGAAAFAAVKTQDAVVMALTAIPTYALARRILSQGWSLGVAALVVLEPWLAYSSLAMTEALFLPVFTAFALTLVLMLERPTVRRQLLVLIVLAVLVGIRPQALVFAGSIVVAVALRGLFARSAYAAAREHRIILGGLAVAALAVLIALAVGVSVPAGSAGSLLTLRYNPVDLAKWTLWNLGVYELALGVIALAAFPLALDVLLRRSASERERSVGITCLVLTAALLVSVAVLSSSQYGLGILHERNLFYATPLVLVCLAHWLSRGLQRPKPVAVAVALAAVAVPAALPPHLVRITDNVDSPTAAWFTQLEQQTGWGIREATIGIAAVGAGAFLLVRRPLVPILAVALAFVILAAPLDYSGSLRPGENRELAWVDRALPGHATATLVHVGYSRPDQPCAKAADEDQRTLAVWTEFFNARVDRVYHMGEEIPDGVPSPMLSVAPGGIVQAEGRPFAPRYVVLDSRQPIVGQRLARFNLDRLGHGMTGGASLSLWRVHRPLGFLAHAQPLPPRGDGQQC
jgi:uncharacterized membrane protein